MIQLPTDIRLEDVEELVCDDDWWMSQKFDGQRLQVVAGDGRIDGYSRSGNSVSIGSKRVFDSLCELTNDGQAAIVLDGELVNGEYMVFDCLGLSGEDLYSQPYVVRHSLLDAILITDHVHAVKIAETLEEKETLFAQCRDNNIEGVVFQHRLATYHDGRTLSAYKYKFVKDVDCIVTDANSDGRNNFTLSVYRDRNLTEIGKVSALTGDGPRITIGDVVAVKCLYATPEGRLYQPTTPMLRADKTADECTFAQIEAITTNKEII